MSRSQFVLLLVVCLSACASPSRTIAATPTVQSVTISIPSEWTGAIMYTGGTTDSIIVKFTDTGGTLNIEPQTQAFEITGIQYTDSKISFKVKDQNEMSFSGNVDGSQIIGQVEQNGQTHSFALLPLSSNANNSLNDFPGTYQFQSGEALLINLAPEYSSSGLYFFGQGLMVTHFGTGAIRALYPNASDSFLVGSGRARGYSFMEQIIFQRNEDGHVTGLTWQTRDPSTGELGTPEEVTRLALTSEIVHFTSKDGTKLTGLLTLPATPGPYPAIMMLHGSERGTRDNFSNQQMSAFMASRRL